MIEYGVEKYILKFEEYSSEIESLITAIEKDMVELQTSFSDEMYKDICKENAVEYLQKSKNILLNYRDTICMISTPFRDIEESVADQFKM